jgi:hypothetical protein
MHLLIFFALVQNFVRIHSGEQYPIRYGLCREDDANFRIDERDKIEIRETDNLNRLSIL